MFRIISSGSISLHWIEMVHSFRLPVFSKEV